MRQTVWCLALFLLAQVQPSRTVPDAGSGAEFPPQDQRIWNLQRTGVNAKLVARQLSAGSDDPALIGMLAERERLDEVVRILRRVVDGRPARIPDVFEGLLPDGLYRFRGDSQRELTASLRETVAAARKRLPELDREGAARAERVFLRIDAEAELGNWNLEARLARFVEEYRGTEAALLAEVELVGGGGVSQPKLDRLDGFIAAHPGTAAAAKALYLKGFQLQFNAIGTIEPRGSDPTERFIRLMTIARELESGSYPRGEWVDKAPSLVYGFFAPREAPIAPANIDRMLGAYQEFVRTHFRLDDESPAGNGIGYVVTAKMAELFERKGDEVGGIEGVLMNLEGSVPDPAAVRYLRALFYMKKAGPPDSPARVAMLSKARETLGGLSSENTGLYSQKALATLASLDLAEGDYTNARAAFQKYRSVYPRSSWSWVAGLRAGQCEERLGNPAGAAALYLEVARENGDLPLASVLGHAYAARANESAGDFAAALAEHKAALAGWDNDFGLTYSTYVRRTRGPDELFVVLRDEGEVAKPQLPHRIAQLERSLSLPGGALLERGRWMVSARRYADALSVLQEVQNEHARSATAAEARYLAHKARLQRALELADVENPDAAERTAIDELEALSREPVDFAVVAARIARASQLWRDGASEEAERLMMEALTAWHVQQRPSKPARGLEEDVVAIRSAAFLPAGGGVYGGERWNAFSWPEIPPLFAIVNPEVPVKLHDGEITRISLVQSLPGAASRVLFVDDEQLAVLRESIVKLGGTKRRQPGHVMETPNQPVGASMNILTLWNKFFAARPGHWGGWDLQTYPVITQIEFTNAERTKAAARVTVGYSGATVRLEKRDGKWIATELTDQWIT
jgi:tetratricopeptide (TPR) repeat protein